MTPSLQSADRPGAIATRHKRRLTPPEASAYLVEEHGLKVAVATLNKLRCVGGGPPFHKAGRGILYSPDALDAWALARLGPPKASTSDGAGG